MNVLSKFFPGVHRERESGMSGQFPNGVEEFLQYTENYLNKGLAVWGLGDKQQVVELHQFLGQSLLITSDDRKDRLVGLIQTAVEANEANTIEPVIITPDRHLWVKVVNNGDPRLSFSRQGVFSPYRKEAQELIMSLAGIVEQRRSGRNMGRTFLLVIDEFQVFAGERLDSDVARHLGWLIEEGHNGSVLTVATANIDVLNRSHRGRELLNSFSEMFHTEDPVMF